MLCVWNLVADKRTEILLSSGFRPFHSNGEFLSPSQSPWLHAVLCAIFRGPAISGHQVVILAAGFHQSMLFPSWLGPTLVLIVHGLV
jgi:hypothetical protein